MIYSRVPFLLSQIVRIPLFFSLFTIMQSCYLQVRYRKRRLAIGLNSLVRNTNFGKMVTIYHNVELNNVVIGDCSYISPGTKISNCTIGKFCSIGPDVRIGLGRHPVNEFITTHPAAYSKKMQCQFRFETNNIYLEQKYTVIKNDVWIGARAMITDGITVETGAIVAAGAIVTKDVPSYAIVGGVPAKIIKYRFDKEKITRLLNEEWWNFDMNKLQDYLKASRGDK